MSRRKLQLVVNEHGGKTSKLLRAQDTGIETLILAMELPITFLGKSKTAYVEIDKVIAWHERELPHTEDKKRHEDRVLWIARLKEMDRELVQKIEAQGNDNAAHRASAR